MTIGFNDLCRLLHDVEYLHRGPLLLNILRNNESVRFSSILPIRFYAKYDSDSNENDFAIHRHTYWPSDAYAGPPGRKFGAAIIEKNLKKPVGKK